VAEPGRTQVYGLHAVRAAIQQRPQAIRSARLLDSNSERLRDIVDALKRHGIRIQHTSRGDLDRVCDGGRHQGVVLEMRAAEEFSIGHFEDLVLARGRELRLLVLDQVEDPRNLGACLRTADAAGIDAVVVPRARAASLSPAARKAATDAAETVPVFRAPNLARTLAWLKQAGVWLVGTDAAAPGSIYECKLEPPVALLLGGEGRGLRRLSRESCDELVAIPMHGTVESLNVSVAAGLVMFELLRQSPKKPPHA
jgi:23S rRNA (guanosine2251-2'-O)-methyltransferase